jgi:hypothetical protein
MSVLLFRAEKFPTSDRNAFAQAALAFCRASKSLGDVSGRFYWIGPNSIGFIFQGTKPELLNRLNGTSSEQPDAELELARFALADLAEVSNAERWMDPGQGEATYRAAGRTA